MKAITPAMKRVKIHGRVLTQNGNKSGWPLICVPLVARTSEALLTELAAILPKNPDVLEWRVDFFDEIHDTQRVVTVAKAIRQLTANVPIIFTRRAFHEGGEAITIAEESVVELYEAVCASSAVDFIDYEMSQSPVHRAKLRTVSHLHDVAMIMSYHNFDNTPPMTMLVDKLTEAEAAGADVAKVAVMPHKPADVLTLLEATLTASQTVQIPIITMSMGAAGVMTRLCGHLYGSALTFAAGQARSAPGQIPIEALRAALKTLGGAAEQK